MAEFNVKTVSCSSKITAKIELNIVSLEREYIGCVVNTIGNTINKNELNFKKYFDIDSGKGSTFAAGFFIQSISRSSLSFGFRILHGVQKMEYQMDLVINEIISKSLKGAVRQQWSNRNVGHLEDHLDIVKIPEKLRSVKGHIIVEFEPSREMILKEKFKNYITSCLVFKPDGKGEDFTIVCQGEEFGFNKSILCNISPAFEAMLTNPCLKENQEGRVEIIDTTPKTIQGLKNILTENYIMEKDITVDLLILADKYRIEPLYKFCQEHLCDSITKETILDVVKAADLISDEELMSKSAEFIAMNRGTFEENPAWDKFCEENPKCSNKILKLMMKKKK